MSWEDGSPLDPPDRDDYESVVERARAWQTECPACGGPVVEAEIVVADVRGCCASYGLRCAAGEACAGGGWSATDEALAQTWAEAHESDPAEERDNGDGPRCAAGVDCEDGAP